jgi:hypothetical protein
VVRVRVEGDVIEGARTSLVRVRVEGDGIDGDDFVINELEIRTQRVSNFLFQSFWESVDSFIDFLFTWISIGSRVTNHISRQLDSRFRFSTLNYSGVHVFCLLTLHCSIFFILSKCCNPIGQLYRCACSKESIDFFLEKSGCRPSPKCGEYFWKVWLHLHVRFLNA